jgi:hypothetical protein
VPTLLVGVFTYFAYLAVELRSFSTRILPYNAYRTTGRVVKPFDVRSDIPESRSSAEAFRASRLWRFPDPPQNSGDDLPSVPGAQSDGFVSAILWLEHVGVVVAPEARYRQTIVFVPRDDDFLHKLWVSGEAYEPLRNNHKVLSAVA